MCFTPVMTVRAGRDAYVAGRDLQIQQVVVVDRSGTEVAKLIAAATRSSLESSDIAGLSDRLRVTQDVLRQMLIFLGQHQLDPDRLAETLSRQADWHHRLIKTLTESDAASLRPVQMQASADRARHGDYKVAERLLLDASDPSGGGLASSNGADRAVAASQIAAGLADIRMIRLDFGKAGDLYSEAAKQAPETDAKLRSRYLSLQAEALLLNRGPSAAIALQRTALGLLEDSGADDFLIASAARKLGRTLLDLGKVAAAQRQFRKALAFHDRATMKPDPQVIEEGLEHVLALLDLAHTMDLNGRTAGLARTQERALEILRRLDETDQAENILRLGLHAAVLRDVGRVKDALPIARRQLTRARKLLGSRSPWVWCSYAMLGGILEDLRRHADAEQWAWRALTNVERLVGHSHPMALGPLKLLLHVLFALNRPDEAEPLARKRLDICLRAFGHDHLETGASHALLGTILSRQKRDAEATDAYRDGLVILAAQLPADHRDVLQVRGALALSLLIEHEFPEAVQVIIAGLMVKQDDKLLNSLLTKVKQLVGNEQA